MTSGMVDALVALILSIAVGGLIWLIGHLIYLWEERRRK